MGKEGAAESGHASANKKPSMTCLGLPERLGPVQKSLLDELYLSKSIPIFCMSLLFSAHALSKSYGSRVLFKDLSISLFEGDRLGLIGPNGSGKSTLLTILAGIEQADEGTISARRGLKMGYVPQTCEFPDLPPKDILLEAMKNDPLPDYEKEVSANKWLSKLNFKGNELSAAKLSGGWKKRLALAKELLSNPDVLLLDEPTNHLDLEGILWLEKFLSREAPPYILVSHDRYFLQNATNRIVEIDRVYPKGLFEIEGSYSHFLEQKEQFLSGQLQQERALASKSRREIDWLRRSPKARTTKSQSRVDAAEKLLDEFSSVKERNRQKRASISFSASERETRKLIVAKNLAKDLGGRTLFDHLDFTFLQEHAWGLWGLMDQAKQPYYVFLGVN